MKDKKLYFLILSFIICILSISAISATENTVNKDVISADNNKYNNIETNIQHDEASTSKENSEINLEENNNNDKESKSETDKTTRSNNDALTFTDLNTTINNNTDSAINLTNNYKYNIETDNNFQAGIYINRNLTIDGKGITIDGNNMARIFKVDDNVNVEFHNIKFINSKANSGGAIYGGNAYNCEFTENQANGHGGAILKGNAYNCIFTKNNATENGGAIYQGNATNCTFTENNAAYGGAIYQGNAYNSTFTNNNAAYGGAINHGNATNCTFTKNEADGYDNCGGAIYQGNAYNSTFTENMAWNGDGGAIYNGSAYNCTFTNNIAYDKGGVIYQGNAYNCTFTDNEARATDSHGGVIYQGNAYNCTFTNNNAGYGGAIYNGSAYHCTFTNNTGNIGGGIAKGNAYNCTFTENLANFGGAMNGREAISCIFINNRAVVLGGAMLEGEAISCIFINNRADQAGEAMNEGNAILCKFYNNTCENTTIIPVIINVLNYTSHYSPGERLKFNLTADDKLLDGFNTTIEIYKDDLLVKTVYALTGDGWVVDLEPGNYTAKLSLTDYPDEKPSNATIIVRNKTTITAKPVSTIYNVGKNLIITLKDQNGKAIKGAILTVNLAGAKKYTTDAKGQVTINITTLTPKTYNVKIRYGGSDIFNASIGSVKVTVKKATPKITAKQAIYKLKLRTKKYTAIFKDNKNKALKNTKVSLKINGKNYITKTNSKGQAVFKITNLKKKGRYIAVITIPTSKYYNKLSKKVKITVKQ